MKYSKRKRSFTMSSWFVSENIKKCLYPHFKNNYEANFMSCVSIFDLLNAINYKKLRRLFPKCLHCTANISHTTSFCCHWRAFIFTRTKNCHRKIPNGPGFSLRGPVYRQFNVLEPVNISVLCVYCHRIPETIIRMYKFIQV